MSPGLPDFDSKWNFADPAASEGEFQRLVPDARASGDGSYLAGLLTQLARAQGLQRKFDEAHQTLDEVESRLSEATEAAKVRFLLERGRVWNSSGQPDRARPLFLQAWQLAREAGDEGHAVDAAHMLGIVEPPAEALLWNLKALELAERSSQPRAQKWLGALYNNIGWSHHDAGDYEKALDVFERALRWRQQQGQPTATRIARWSVGRALRSLARVQEALDVQRGLLEELERVGERDGYVYEELAEGLLIQGKAQEAKPYFALAHEELSKDAWLAEKEPVRLQRLAQLGGKIDGAPAGPA